MFWASCTSCDVQKISVITFHASQATLCGGNGHLEADGTCTCDAGRTGSGFREYPLGECAPDTTTYIQDFHPGYSKEAFPLDVTQPYHTGVHPITGATLSMGEKMTQLKATCRLDASCRWAFKGELYGADNCIPSFGTVSTYDMNYRLFEKTGPGCSIDCTGSAAETVQCFGHGTCDVSNIIQMTSPYNYLPQAQGPQSSSNRLPHLDGNDGGRPACTCDSGYSGDRCGCGPSSALSSHCSGHGMCLGKGQFDLFHFNLEYWSDTTWRMDQDDVGGDPPCACDPGWSGSHCELDCSASENDCEDTRCGGHGLFDDTSGKCTCAAGYAGHEYTQYSGYHCRTRASEGWPWRMIPLGLPGALDSCRLMRNKLGRCIAFQYRAHENYIYPQSQFDNRDIAYYTSANGRTFMDALGSQTTDTRYRCAAELWQEQIPCADA